MKYLRISLFFICLLISTGILAQQNHFIYLQTDNKQPFYLKLTNKIYSSSISGYLIVPKLKVGLYDFVVGFPKNEWPEQTIRCALEDKDYGYLIKNFGDKGWGFFNLQTLNIVMANANGIQPEPVAEIKGDSFSDMLSTAVNDPNINQKESVEIKPKIINNEAVSLTPKNIRIPDEKKSSSIESISKNEDVVKEAVVDTKLTSLTPVVITVREKIKDTLVSSAPSIIKKKTYKTAEGIEMVYLDSLNGNQDTINIFIPSDKKNTANQIEPTNKSKTENQIVENKSLPVQEEKKETKFLPIDLVNPNITVAPVLDSAKKEEVRSPIINSDCKYLASEEDFLKLRKKMAAAGNDDNMIIVAKKTFKLKCFFTEQIKNLSVLFLKDADKYNFFDAAYPFVSDAQNYSLLQNQLTDSYYLARFKVMLRH